MAVLMLLLVALLDYMHLSYHNRQLSNWPGG